MEALTAPGESGPHQEGEGPVFTTAGRVCGVSVAGHGHFSNSKGTGHHVDLGSSSSEPKAVQGSFVSAPFAANLAFSISYSGCSGAQHGPGTLW